MNLSVIKSYIRSHPVYAYIRPIYKIIRIDARMKVLKERKFKKECVKRYVEGERLVNMNYGGVDVIYEAISEKNFIHLLSSGQNEERTMNFFMGLLKCGDSVLDIGGHTGMYTIPIAKKIGPKGKVYVFEPEKKGFDAITRNIELNKLYNVIPFNWAVSNEHKTINFFIRPDKDTHSIFEATPAPSPTGTQNTIPVQVSSIDYMIENNLIMHPSYIKLDVEGAELKVLDGMKKSLNMKLKGILIEVHEDVIKQEGILNPRMEVDHKMAELGLVFDRELGRNHIYYKAADLK